MDSALSQITERVRSAIAHQTPLRLRGGGSKDFHARALTGEVIDTRGLQGVVSYEPSELVVTARAGTALAELQALLADHGQCLAFDPPHFSPGATVGGMVAAGLSGPARASVGAVRDYVLGVEILNGRAELLRFGGQVMKNVAGYDVPRLLAGSLGTLGLIAEVSLKVLPFAVATQTLRFAMAQDAALDSLNRWGGQPLPITASAWSDGVLHLRLEGAAAAVSAATRKLGGEMGGEAVDEPEAAAFWAGLREQTHPFFTAGAVADAPLWRLSVPSLAPPLDLPGAQLIEWGGAQRWLRGGAANTAAIRAAAQRAGGHATLFRAGAAERSASDVFQPLSAPLARIHRNLKTAFDPHGVFNPGRMYPDF